MEINIKEVGNSARFNKLKALFVNRDALGEKYGDMTDGLVRACLESEDAKVKGIASEIVEVEDELRRIFDEIEEEEESIRAEIQSKVEKAVLESLGIGDAGDEEGEEQE